MGPVGHPQWMVGNGDQNGKGCKSLVARAVQSQINRQLYTVALYIYIYITAGFRTTRARDYLHINAHCTMP